MNTTTSYKIIKLTNGENIICQLNDDVDNGEYKLNFPLKMEIRSMVTEEGVVESLNLSRWNSPYTEQSFFSIKSEHVLLIANASEGLSRYYEHVMKEINNSDNLKTTKQTWDNIDDEDVYDELLEELKTDNNTIH